MCKKFLIVGFIILASSTLTTQILASHFHGVGKPFLGSFYIPWEWVILSVKYYPDNQIYVVAALTTFTFTTCLLIFSAVILKTMRENYE